MGRKSATGKPRGNLIMVRVTADEMALLRKASGNEAVSSWVRDVAIKAARRKK